jgi:hypothetical protein
MPLTGTRDLSDLAAEAPHIPSLDIDHWDLPKAQILTVQYEIDDDAMVSLLPPALHPTIPPTLIFTVTRVPESPAGAYLLAEVRVGCRSGARPRGFLVRAFTDSDQAVRALGERYGYPLKKAAVTLEKRYDRIHAMVETNHVVLDVSLMNPEPISGNDLQYLSNLNIARVPREGGEAPRLVQIDPDYVFHSADRGKPQLNAFDATAWELAGARPYYPVSASYAVADISMPALRYLVDPTKPPLASVEKL